ncbi:adenylate/guanylate cyclase domain-containing protein [Marimonas sp. MJW-29]|uniref:Adenylate/guanylate cyclase domain-containing protein n=1 Tax=Sulfitobacter sediminis TaxID=3234186 RepID=A0ABV3RPL2_9RHOB
MKRHLRAILAADMVGYSRLIEADEFGVVQRQKAHLSELIEPLLAKHDGRLVKLMGDGVLATFDSVIDAVSFAVEVQRAMPGREAAHPEETRIRYRIGVNLGDVLEDEGDIFGDGVNIAARLEEMADPGGICISGTAYDHLKSQVDVGYEPLGEVSVKNIEHPVRAYRVLLDADAAIVPAEKRRKRPFIPAVLVALLALGVGGWLAVDRLGFPSSDTQTDMLVSENRQDDRPSIAVLPFNNLGGGPEQDYFSDGMTEDLITDLSQVSGLFVLARNTTFAYKNRAVNVQKVGEELDVAFVLEGSVRKAGERVRINAQLIDAKTGGHVWAARYDGELTNVFALQDTVVQQIVEALSVELEADEEERLKRDVQVNSEAYDLVLRGLERMRRFSPNTNLEAREFFEAALEVDPDYGRALADLALTYAMEAEQHWTDSPQVAGQKAIQLAEEARAIDPRVAQTHFVLTVAYRVVGRVEDSIDAAHAALKLDPNYADGYATLASSLNYANRPEEALAAIRLAIELNPIAAFFYTWIEGQSYYIRGDLSRARELFERVVERNPAFTAGHRMLAATYVELDMQDDAEWAAHEVIATAPGFTVDTDPTFLTFTDEATRLRYKSSLRSAGLP